MSVRDMLVSLLPSGRKAGRGRKAVIHRMVMPEHVCPYGLKAKDLLERECFEVDDRWLTTREETDAFQAEHGVETTPQIFIEGERVGGYDDLRAHLGHDVPDADHNTYRPVIALFVMGFLMAVATAAATASTDIVSVRTFELFIAISMCLLAVQKLKDVESFSTMFLNYDLLARRWVRYGYIYPYAEGLAGLLMIAGIGIWLASPLALFIGGIGAVSVFRAVYIEKRNLKCACVGGDSNVPLGAISLTENVMMVLMGIWMPLKALAY
ncbi:MauE/DoxX family redox-associated membrane protein [Minwuia sp.]|uniref:MauE/DoxX family redox-associated membrane protein n=1 Tax=Minwuia sp. TaxID=2493630 RepID=UPI003A8EEBF6